MGVAVTDGRYEGGIGRLGRGCGVAPVVGKGQNKQPGEQVRDGSSRSEIEAVGEPLSFRAKRVVGPIDWA